MAFLIDQLNNSGLFAQSAYSACIATKDSDGNDITSTYLTGVDLTPYQTTADMINYQTVSGMSAYATTDELANKLDSTAFNIPDSANWNSNYETVQNNSATWNTVTDKLDATAYEPFDPTYISGTIDNKLDTTAFSDVSGTFLTAHQSLDDYATKNYVQTNSAVITAMIPTDYYPNNNPSGFITGVNLSNYYKKNETSGADELANAFNNIPAGDTEVNNTVHNNSANWNNTYTTVSNNSASWSQTVSFTGVTTDTTLTGDGLNTPLGVAETDPLSSDESINVSTAMSAVVLSVNSSWFNNAVNSAITGTQGDAEVNAAVHNNSATWNTVTNKLNTTAFSTVSGNFYPYSNPSGFITGVDLTPYQTTAGMTAYQTKDGMTAYQTTASMSDYQTTADMSNYQTTANMTAYEPKINYGYSAGAVSSINGSAILGETIPYEVYGISAGDNVTIWEDNNTLWISASGGAGGAGDMEVSNLDYATLWDDVGNPFYTISGYDGSAFGLGSFYVTNNDSILKNGGDSLIEINDTGIRLDNPDGGYSEQNSFYGGDYFHIGSYSNPSAYIEGYANGRIDLYDDNHISGRLDVSSISSWNDVHNTVQTNSASWVGGSTYTGDVQGALDEVYTNSSVWLTAHQDISNKLDVSSFSDVSASFLTAVPAGYATENWVTAQGYITGVDLTPYLTTATYAADSGSFATTSMLNDYQTTAGMTSYYTKTDTSSKQELNDAIGNVETLLASL